MMRTIKFRAKCIADGSTWVYGSLAVQGEAAFIGNPIWINLNPDTVGQFTGLLDCNGVEIYEGDLLRDDEFTYEVYWLLDVAAFMVEEYQSKSDAPKIFLLSDIAKESKVIGNIY